MKNQKIVEIENGNITTIFDGSFERGYSPACQDEALQDLLNDNGTDWKEYFSKLKKIIIGCSRRHPEDEEYFKEMMPNNWFETLKEYYSRTDIKIRTKKEKQKLINRINNDKY